MLVFILLIHLHKESKGHKTQAMKKKDDYWIIATSGMNEEGVSDLLISYSLDRSFVKKLIFKLSQFRDKISKELNGEILLSQSEGVAGDLLIDIAEMNDGILLSHSIENFSIGDYNVLINDIKRDFNL